MRVPSEGRPTPQFAKQDSDIFKRKDQVLLTLVRSDEMSSARRSWRRPFKVALTTAMWLFEPIDFVRTFLTPAASRTARTPPPAFKPVPGDAGFRSTLPPSYCPNTSCGIVSPLSLT